MTHASRAAAAAILAILPAGAALAQGFTGAEISGEILGFTDDLDFGEIRYRGALEFDVGAGFGVAADLSYHGWRALGTNGRNMTIHGLWDGLGFATVGAYVARDSFEGEGATGYGIEAAGDFGGLVADGSLGMVDGDGDSALLMLANARFDIGGFAPVDGLAATARFGRLGGDADATRFGVGAEYDLGFGPTVYGEVGRVSTEGDGATYVGVGARLGIGQKGGTTFGSRGIFEVIPGF
jgi:hypothetical protein